MKGHSNFRAIQLENNYGLTDQAIISEAEALFTMTAAIEGMPQGNFDKEHLKSIHKHVLGDMYPWAGQFRTAELSSVGNQYGKTTATAALIEKELDRTLSVLQEIDKSMPLDYQDFADKMAMTYTKLYAISPFPDGNARAARFFIDAFAEKHEMSIGWEKVPADAFHAATKMALNGNHTPLQRVFRSITQNIDLYEQYSTKAVADKVTEIAKTVGLNRKLMPIQATNTTELKELAKLFNSYFAEDLKRLATTGNSFRDWEKTSIKHELNNTVGKTVMSMEAFNEAIKNLEAGKGTPKPLPGMS